MKTLIIKTCYVIIFFSTISQSQNWIQQYDGIPIHTGLWWGFTNDSRFRGAIDSMKSIVDIVTTDIGISDTINLNPEDQLNFLKNNGLKLIPVKSRTSINSPIYNWIQHYTDAKYSVWEAEGSNPSEGDAKLEYDPNIMTEFSDGDTTFIKLNLSATALSNINLIRGPYYVQDTYYYASDKKNDTVYYRADFRLKLEYNDVIQPPLTDNPNDPVCVIQVTYSTPLGTQALACTYIINQDTIVRSRLENYFKDFPLIYELVDGDCYEQTDNEIPMQATFHSSTRSDSLVPGPRSGREYVEFRVVWLGKPQYLLSIDKVTVSDKRGRELFVDKDSSLIYRPRIIAQANSLGADDLVVGWLGIDEPVSIDIYEPIKLVTQLLNNSSQGSRPLYLPLMGKYDGAFRNRGDKHGAMRLSPWVEMKKRIGDMNIWQDFYLYDYPCNENSTQEICKDDWRSANIWRMAELNYKPAYELDPNYGVSLQCGEVHNTQANERDIEPHELLYNTNVALMYGAKFLSLYSYFAQRSTDSCLTGWICHAIVDIDSVDGHLIYTPKYTMLKNTIKPRLNGLMGKTLKKLIPFADSLGKNPSTSYSLNFNRIKKS